MEKRCLKMRNFPGFDPFGDNIQAFSMSPRDWIFLALVLAKGVAQTLPYCGRRGSGMEALSRPAGAVQTMRSFIGSDLRV